MRKNSLQNYIKNKCKLGNGEDLRKIVKPLISDKCKHQNTAISISENGKIITDAKSVCNIFIDYYINIANEVSTARILGCTLNDTNNIIEKYAKHSI